MSNIRRNAKLRYVLHWVSYLNNNKKITLIKLIISLDRIRRDELKKCN